MAMCSILEDAAEAKRMFLLEDAMDVGEMVKCLDTIGWLAEVPFISFTQEWQDSVGNKAIYRELRLVGHVMRLMATLIIGHDGSALDDGNHLSVSEYLERCSRLAHLLFFSISTKQDKVPCKSELQELAGHNEEHVHSSHCRQSKRCQEILLVPQHKQTH